MFSNCIDCVGRQKKKRKKKKGIKKIINTGIGDTIQGMDRREILKSLLDKFLIPVYKISDYVTPPPRGIYHM